MSEASPAIQASAIKPPEVAANTYYHLLDPQNRITVPREWRAMISEEDIMLVMPDPDTESLTLLLPTLTREIYKNAQQTGTEVYGEEAETNAAFFAAAENITRDTAGRIRICDRLLAHANITVGVKLAGSGRHIVLSAATEEEVRNKGANISTNINASYRNALANLGLKKKK